MQGVLYTELHAAHDGSCPSHLDFLFRQATQAELTQRRLFESSPAASVAVSSFSFRRWRARDLGVVAFAVALLLSEIAGAATPGPGCGSAGCCCDSIDLTKLTYGLLRLIDHPDTPR